jgi:tetratricopeptide (TPR) repeat protein
MNDSTDETSSEAQVCPICWNCLPLRPKELPCGHEFCRKCIKDLKRHHSKKNESSSCPMCRGPIDKPSIKRLWKEFKAHEKSGVERTKMQRLQVSLSASTRLLLEAKAEYEKATEKLEECLSILKADPKNNHKTIHVMCKLIEILPLAKLSNHEERTKELLKEIICRSEKPVPRVHLKLAKMLHRHRADDMLQDAIQEYACIVEIAKGSSSVRTNRHAKKLRGPAHYGLALCWHRLGNHKRAAREYDHCEKYNVLQDYGLAAESHYFNGNYLQAMEYGSKQLHKESTSPAVETLLLMARICRGYFLSIRSYRGIDALDYQAMCETYRRCVRHAQLFATNDNQRQECIRHLELLAYLLFPMKKSSLVSVSRSLSMFSEERTETEDGNETEDYEASVEL